MSYDRPLTHQEYLKLKYLSQNDYDEPASKKKKKSKKTNLTNIKNPTVKIIDEDVDFRSLANKHGSDEEDLYFGTKEEKPIIEAVIDERPLHMRTDPDNRSKWKAIGDPEPEEEEKQEDDNEKTTETLNNKKTLAGKKAGLSDAKDIKKELAELKRKNAKFIEKMDDETSGKNAKTVFRDRKTGKIREIEKELEAKQKEEEEKAIREAEKKAVYDRWSKGLTQRKEQIKKIESDLHEMSKPLARYEDDIDRDKYLREIEREDDPMLAEIRKKREEERRKDPNYKVYPKYQGPPAPPNRFNIKPGYRWDGVDRSNGYEAKWFSKLADREAIQEESYHWSVQDM